MREKWAVYGEGIRLVILESPYRLLVEPIMEYIESLLAIAQPNEMLTIVVPAVHPSPLVGKPAPQPDRAALRFALLFKPGVVIVEVPYQV